MTADESEGHTPPASTANTKLTTEEVTPALKAGEQLISPTDASPDTKDASLKRKRTASTSKTGIKETTEGVKKLKLHEESTLDDPWDQVLLLPWRGEGWKNINAWA